MIPSGTGVAQALSPQNGDPLAKLQRSALEELAKQIDELEARKRYVAKDFFHPYPKQLEFFAQGARYVERLLSAGNQLGKTEAGAFEAACHLTGLYPAWWPGRRWTRPNKGWVCGEGGLLVRDGPQKKLCGEPGVEEAFGTGMIPRKDFSARPTLSRGVSNAYDTIQVQHYDSAGKPDGTSIAKFKSYDQGRIKFQSDTIDWIWFDEEPPSDIYTEGLARFSATGGMAFMTFTPLKGMSDVALMFFSKDKEDFRGLTSMTIDDVTHISEEEKKRVIASYPAHERAARSRGIPMQGSGRIFQYSQESISEPAIRDVPLYWRKLWGVDFGIDHPFGAVLILFDADNDVIHVHHCIRVRDQLPIMHAAAMKPVAARVPVAWPHDGTTRSKSDGEHLDVSYRKQGLLMLGKHATFEDGTISTEAGVLEMQERMATGRFKVAEHLSDWWEEFHMYHRKDGLIVKEHDDLMSASRIAVMAHRLARAVPLGGGHFQRRGSGLAKGVDFNVF